MWAIKRRNFYSNLHLSESKPQLIQVKFNKNQIQKIICQINDTAIIQGKLFRRSIYDKQCKHVWHSKGEKYFIGNFYAEKSSIIWFKFKTDLKMKLK